MKKFFDTIIEDDRYEHKYVQISHNLWVQIMNNETMKRFLDVVTNTSVLATGRVASIMGKTLIINPSLKNEEFILTNYDQIMTKNEIEVHVILNL